MRMNSPMGKSILALVRDGAFAHAGETEAIELALDAMAKDAKRAVLDAGCGLGGTAEYVRKHGWGQVSGFDIDAVSIEAARTRFPQCTFAASDVGHVGELWASEFDLIYCFNSFYAFPDQPAALREFAKVAKPGATLLIFDYTDPEKCFASSSLSQRDEGSFWQPLHPPTFSSRSRENGWELQAFHDITAEYIRWYNALVERIEAKRGAVIADYGEPAYVFVHTFYSALRDAIVDGALGGGIFRFERG